MKKTTKKIDTYIFSPFFLNLGNFQKLKKPCFVFVFRVFCCGKKEQMLVFGSSESHQIHDLFESRLKEVAICVVLPFFSCQKKTTHDVFFRISMDLRRGICLLRRSLFPKKSTADYTELPDFADLWMFVDVRTSENSRVTLYKLEPLKQRSSTHHGSAPFAKTREDETHLALEIHFHHWLVVMIHETTKVNNEGKQRIKRSFQYFGVPKTSPPKKMRVWGVCKRGCCSPEASLLTISCLGTGRCKTETASKRCIEWCHSEFSLQKKTSKLLRNQNTICANYDISSI